MSEQGWTVHVEAAGEAGDVDADAADRFLDELHDRGGSVSVAQDASRYGATFTVRWDEAQRPTDAANAGCGVFTAAASAAGLPDLPVVRLEALTFEEQDAELERPLVPELVGIKEIAKILDEVGGPGLVGREIEPLGQRGDRRVVERQERLFPRDPPRFLARCEPLARISLCLLLRRFLRHGSAILQLEAASGSRYTRLTRP